MIISAAELSTHVGLRPMILVVSVGVLGSLIPPHSTHKFKTLDFIHTKTITTSSPWPFLEDPELKVIRGRKYL